MLFRASCLLLLATSIAILGFGVLVAAYPPFAGPYDERMVRALGIATTGMGLFGTAITLTSYRRKQKWAWFALWYYPIFWTLHLLDGLPPGNDHIHQVVFSVVSVLGLMLPARHFFPRRQ
jgi:hypothetical protein